MDHDFQADLDAIAQIGAVPSILDVVCRLTGMGFAAVARVTEDRWIACGVHDEIAFGLRPGGELKVETTICQEVRGHREAVFIDHVATDSVYCGHPTAEIYGFQSYVSVPIIMPDGRLFGTLCAIDPKPAIVNTPGVIGTFKLFADMIAFHLDAHERLARSEAVLLDERHASELREQFIAVLGHDLRNPLASIDAGARMLERPSLDVTKIPMIVGLMRGSVMRMSALIDNVLDFARGRLGGGLSLERNADAPLEPVLDQVIAELQSASPARIIEADIALCGPVYCDRARIGQLFSNLLGNALTYGTPKEPIRVRARIDAGSFILSVANAGEPIPPAALERMFQPFARGAVKPSQQGLGLGLYIAAEVARAHGGKLEVSSNDEETRFTLQMPLA